MADQSRTISAYSLQWDKFRILRPEEDEATFFNRTGLQSADLAGARVLDAGCGMGRYLIVAARANSNVVGIDLSTAVEAARDLTRDLRNVSLARADLLRTPFATETFDHIYSLGVIDHTPSPRAVFLELVRLLKPGGRIAVWVYHRESRPVEAVMDVHRAISTRLPLGMLVTLSRLTAPIGGLKRRMMASRSRIIERAGVVLNLLTIGVSMHPDPEVRICDTLDWYAPRFLFRFTKDEVMEWFRVAGLTEIHDLSQNQAFFHAGQGNGINLCGTKPRQ